MSAYLWEPINAWGSSYGPGPLDQVTIQGQNGVIRNLLIRGNCSPDGYPYACGFIGLTKNPITVKNLTFDSANVSINGQYYGNQVGVVIGRAYCDDVIMDGVHVTNSTVKDMEKSAVWSVILPSRIRAIPYKLPVENTKIIGAYNCGGLIGLNEHCSVTVTNCTTKKCGVGQRPGTALISACSRPRRSKDYTGNGAIAQCVTGIYYQSGGIEPAMM